MAYPWIETPGQPLDPETQESWVEVEPADSPPEGSGYQAAAEGQQTCGGCLHQVAGVCQLYAAKVAADHVCHDWKPDIEAAGGIIDQEVEYPFAQVGMAEMLFSESVECVEDDNGLIWKPALRTGEWAMSPGPGAKPVSRPLRVKLRADDPTKEIGLQDLVEAFKDRAMDHVTVPLSHADRVDENTGFVQELRIVEDETNPGHHVLMAGYRFTEPDIKDKVKRGTIANNSVGVLFNYFRKRDGKKFPQALGHIALTNKPWIDGLVPFGVNASEGHTEGDQVVFCSEIRVKPYMRGGKLVKGYDRKGGLKRMLGQLDKEDLDILSELASKVSKTRGVYTDEFDGAKSPRARKAIDKRLGRMYTEGYVKFGFSGSRGTQWGLTPQGRELIDSQKMPSPRDTKVGDRIGTTSRAISDFVAADNGFKRINDDRDRSNGEDVFDGGDLGRVYVKHGSGMDTVLDKGQLVGVTSEAPDGEVVFDWAEFLQPESGESLDLESRVQLQKVLKQAFGSLKNRPMGGQSALFSEIVAEVEEFLALGDSGPLPGGKPGKDDNWVDQVGGLPRYVREVARELMKQGRPKSRAIAIAISRIKVWAATSKDPKVKAKAAKAIAEWEAKKKRARLKSASSKAKAVNASETTNSGKEVNLTEHEYTPEEMAALLSELDALRKERRRNEVKDRIEQLRPQLGDAPALLSEIHDLMMADSGEPVVTMMLSEDGSEEPTGLTVTDVVERLIAAIPDLKANLSEQHEKREAGDRPDDKERELTVEERALAIATSLSDDEYMKSLSKTQS